MKTVPGPGAVWAARRRRSVGTHWIPLEAHLYTGHPEVQLLLRNRGRTLPRPGFWYLTALVALVVAGLVLLALGRAEPFAAWAAAGGLLVVAGVCEAVGYARAWKGYGTTADAVWGGVALIVAFPVAAGIGMVEAELWSGTTPVFWSALVVVGLGFTGLHASSMEPRPRSARLRRAVEAVAALPEAERARLRADLEAALDVLVERGLVRPTERKEALAAPLGGLAAAFVNENPS